MKKITSICAFALLLIHTATAQNYVKLSPNDTEEEMVKKGCFCQTNY